MTRNFRLFLAVLFGGLLLAGPVLAHHSATAEFDTSKTFTVKGTFPPCPSPSRASTAWPSGHSTQTHALEMLAS